MRKQYFIVVLAHSVHGRIQRVHVPHYVIHLVLAFALFGVIAGIGFVSSYARMLWKVTEFNQLRAEKESLQARYLQLKRQFEERNTQLASLGALASEVSIAFGIKRPFAGAADLMSEGIPAPGFYASLNQFGFLQGVQLSSHASNSPWSWLEDTTPSIWPVRGRLSSSFGRRQDPFLGHSSFHAGVDISAPWGTPIVAAADGVVTSAESSGRYGKRVIIAHGHNGLESHYAHMRDMYVRPGQVVRRGEVIGRVGRSGRTTASHLHYEVRYHGTPVNPYKYLGSPNLQASTFLQAD